MKILLGFVHICSEEELPPVSTAIKTNDKVSTSLFSIVVVVLCCDPVDSLLY